MEASMSSTAADMLKDKLSEAYARFRAINRKLLADDVTDEFKLSLKKEQQSLLLVQIPRLSAQIRRMAEINGEIEEEFARLCPVFKSAANLFICTTNSYFIGHDIYWNINPKIFGKGKDKKESLKDFCKNLQCVLDRRHGRPVRLKIETREELREQIIPV
jgi:hypothetical protein